ncbi:MAG: hypothetical protein NTW21_17755 [Verrucomicrobia bacterium]|nr:hypothetical protein [Verrucomicrobiota bacterium]
MVGTFSSLRTGYGSRNTDKATIVSGPVAVNMLRFASPGKAWWLSMGGIQFKVTIEDTLALAINSTFSRLQQLTPVYRRAFLIVSEGTKDGVAFYSTLGGAAAHGSQDYLNLISAADAFVISHEVGHIFEQRTRVTDTTVLDRWEVAAQQDNISVSNYGNTVRHEDLAEFAYVYALCVDAGQARLNELQALSPRRFALWKMMVEFNNTPPEVTDFRIINGTPRFVIRTIAGYRYRVLYQAGLAGGSWSPVNQTWADGTGGNITLTDPVLPLPAQRFYRVELQ